MKTANTSEDGQRKEKSVVAAHPAAAPRNNSATPDTTAPASWFKNYLPIVMASVSSLGWLGVCLYVINRYQDEWFRSGLTIQDGAMLLAGLLAPVIVVWLIALVFMRADPLREQRLTLAHGLDGLLLPIQVAERRVDVMIERLHANVTSLSSAGDMASDRIKGLETRFQEQITHLFDATHNAEAKAATIQKTLTTERELLQSLSAEMEHRATEIRNIVASLTEGLRNAASETRTEARNAGETMSGHAQTIAASVQQANSGMSDIAASLAGYTAQMHEAALHAEQILAQVGHTMEESRALLSDGIDQMAAKAEGVSDLIDQRTRTIAQISDISQTVETQADDLRRSIDRTLVQSRVALQQLASQYTHELDAILQSHDQSTEKTFAVQKANMSDLLRLQAEAVREALAAETQTVTQSLRAQMDEARTILAEQSRLIAESAAQTASTLGDSVEHLTHQAEKLALTAGETTPRLEEINARMEQHDNAGRHLLQNLEQDLAKAEESIGAHVQKLTDISQNVSYVLDHMVSNTKTQSTELGAAAKSALAGLGQSGAALDAQIRQLQALSISGAEEIRQAVQSLKDETIAAAAETGDVAARLSETENLLRQSHADAITKHDATIDRLTGISQSIREQTGSMIDAAAAAEAQIKEIGSMMVANAREVQSATSEAAIAASNADNAFTRQSGTLKRAAQEIEKSAAAILSRTGQMEDRMTAKAQDEFAKNSSFMIEALSSQAIDLNRVLETDVPDDIWQKYLKGDRSIFARRTVRLGNRQTRNLIAAKYAENAEFRGHAQQYLKDFEQMMSQAIAADPRGALSVTLISSDVGKLYVLLAQSLNRLS